MRACRERSKGSVRAFCRERLNVLLDFGLSLQKACDKRNFTLYMPPLSLCGDNGAMIACAGSYAFDAGIRADSSLNASATMELTDWGDMGNGQ